ncbi:hypothetical protein M0R45_030488 [Rubus argutus]|uniref:DUF7780 domain-containing protein n=1 Tax=Rubus argutus TaxID=59490 RepID=A0AAW1WC05_RUBAR
MGFTAKAKPKSISSSPSSSGENWGMGLLLVFFPEDNNTNSNANANANAIVDKSNKLSSSTSSSSSSTSSASSSTPSPSLPSSFKRSNSNNVLLSKAQSTISICALLVFITLLLFTLSTFEPSPKSHPISASASRRFLSQNSPPVKKPNFNGIHTDTNHSLLLSSCWLGKMWKQKQETQHNQKTSDNQFALQRMGTLYRRGTRAMTDLVVGHVEENVTEPELRLFVRLLHRSGLTARADVVFIFACRSSSRFASVIEEENQSFLKLVRHYRRLNSTTSRKPSSGFDVSQFIKVGKKAADEPLWGRRSSTSTTPRSNSSEEAELTQLSYGSVVGFEVGELDPENSLAGVPRPRGSNESPKVGLLSDATGSRSKKFQAYYVGGREKLGCIRRPTRPSQTQECRVGDFVGGDQQALQESLGPQLSLIARLTRPLSPAALGEFGECQALC